ncbi:T6SS effector amidase Tae4 family protein [Pseudoduganella albidiflava]|uniref:Type VI secretion system amidase effector protein Tae4 n=2 Tax=Pseudoduganella TaxID=1522432 RepID=A0A411X326_9BURK|nr:T6SS effector amidase Tae4 family protein [Pseudoduganella albidiflava]QBI03265.1 hypothetical protein EYF70_22380 [Pseudoduganella albidiflava]GGY68284.1 hypothetical protein GCM10007387_58090 [Pseudoduganella albidiflava]
MKPSFNQVEQNFPQSEKREALYEEIGWSDLTSNPAFYDTCAIRMSVALLRAGVRLPGARMAAKSGRLKGKRIEPGQGKLSQILKRIWGNPEVYKGEQAARDGIGRRAGVASFFRIHGTPNSGGHIDLVLPAASGFPVCARTCFFGAMEVWFWPLK